MGQGYFEVPVPEAWAKEHWEQEAWSPWPSDQDEYWGPPATGRQEDEAWSEEQWQHEQSWTQEEEWQHLEAWKQVASTAAPDGWIWPWPQ